MPALLWAVKNPDAGKLIAAYRHYKQPIPKGLEPPELSDIEQYYWRAYWDLSSERQAGGPIPWTAIRRYFEVDGFGRFADFKRIITAMDSAYLEAIEARRPKKER